mgnify:CR=1 FL=1
MAFYNDLIIMKNIMVSDCLFQDGVILLINMSVVLNIMVNYNDFGCHQLIDIR